MSVKIYSVPAQEELYSGFTVLADGENVPVRIARVSAMPFSRRWPGHQRQIEQSELAGFVSFAFFESVEIKITADRPFEKVCVKPLSKGIVPNVEDGVISFTLRERGGYSVELDGYHNNLHIFADTFADCVSAATFNMDDENLIYFGAGVHRPGTIELKSNQTLAIDEGAVVYCNVRAENADNIRITGTGIIDGSENHEVILYEVDSLGDGNTDVGNSARENTIDLYRCNNVYIEGVTIRDSLVYNISAHGCNYCMVNNIKIIGSWRYNSDGIDFHNSCHVRISNCFVRTFDDCICVKGHDGYQDICDDIIVENCVVWCDWDHALEIGAETRSKNMQFIEFKNCDIIRSMGVALDIFNVDYGDIHNVLFSNINVEYDDCSPVPQIQENDNQQYDPLLDKLYISTLISCDISKHHEYSGGLNTRGYIHNIRFENIHVFAPRMPKCRFSGCDAAHKVKTVLIKNLKLNGKEATPLIVRNDFTEGISFINT